MVKKDEPQRDASAGIYSQVAALAFQLRQLADHELGDCNSVVHLVHPSQQNGPAARANRVSSFTFKGLFFKGNLRASVERCRLCTRSFELRDYVRPSFGA
ncbi:hypothetical protein [Bradyrhizobium archetypum]|uniref:hypothetical protein n=1 Tax=Bradyrhizobium archetypum TaxID=2721160 RepID=UPI001F41955E|nr:hypothetical protein [Bradyrhizobium archetypum]